MPKRLQINLDSPYPPKIVICPIDKCVVEYENGYKCKDCQSEIIFMVKPKTIYLNQLEKIK